MQKPKKMGRRKEKREDEERMGSLCHTLQHVRTALTHCNTCEQQETRSRMRNEKKIGVMYSSHTVLHRTTLHHNATLCNTLQHTALHSQRMTQEAHRSLSNRLPLQFVTRCNTRHHTAPHRNTRHHTALHYHRLTQQAHRSLSNRLPFQFVVHCTTLHHTAPYCFEFSTTHRRHIGVSQIVSHVNL